MALTDEGNGGLNVSMPVAPAYSMPYGGNMGGGLGFGGDGAWILLLLVLGGGWGGFGGFGMGGMLGAGMMGGMWGMDYLYPWLNNSQNINDGFRDQQLSNQVSGIQSAITSGFGDVQTALCGGFAGVNQNVSQGLANTNLGMCQGFNGVNTAISGAQNALAQQMYTNQIADMERSFAAQTQAADCCCKTQTGIADLKYTVAQENCADRQALSDGIRDVIAAQTASTQRILDQLCADKIDAKNDTIAQLRQELLFARGQASQDVQTAELRTAAQTANANLLNEMRSCPIPAQPVYGSQPIFTCPQNQVNGCGCGCGA